MWFQLETGSCLERSARQRIEGNSRLYVAKSKRNSHPQFEFGSRSLDLPQVPLRQFRTDHSSLEHLRPTGAPISPSTAKGR